MWRAMQRVYARVVLCIAAAGPRCSPHARFSACHARLCHRVARHALQGFILVFSITNDSSFTDLKKIHDSIIEAHPLGENVSAQLVARGCAQCRHAAFCPCKRTTADPRSLATPNMRGQRRLRRRR